MKELVEFIATVIITAIITAFIVNEAANLAWKNELVKKDLAAYTVNEKGYVTWSYKE